MRDLEHKYQCTLIAWFDRAYKEHAGRLFAIPNGGARNQITAAKLKKEGVRAGVPDLMLPVARHGFHGLFIEMKKRKEDGGRGPTPNQCHWHDYLDSQGYMVVVCYGVDPAIETIKSYLRENKS